MDAANDINAYTVDGFSRYADALKVKVKSKSRLASGTDDL
jgi:hypothetical protein